MAVPLDWVDTASSSGDLEGYGVYIGIWTNWSKGKVLGSTLTLTRQNGDLLVAVLAFFVTFVFTRFWRILCVILHHQSSCDRPREALYHQRQVAVRNVASPEAAFALFVQMLWAWRKTCNGKHILKVLGVPLLVATICLSASVLASSFSSRVTSGVGDEVLLDGGNCGWINGSRDRLRQSQQTYLLPWVSSQTMSAANYAKECYMANPGGVLSCDTFVKPNLLDRVQIDTNHPCPFGGDICVNSHSNLRIDSGLIDSNEDLGMNAPPELRFQYRMILQCAPLTTENYTTTYNISSNSIYTRYHYGRSNNQTVPGIDWVYEQNRTYFEKRPWGSAAGPQGDYEIGTAYAILRNGTPSPDYYSSMFPIPELTRSDGDLSIVFLSARTINYFEPSDDPWYRAWRPGGNVMDGSPIWIQDGAASPLACLSQYQYCNPALPEGSNCGPLSGRMDAHVTATSLFSQNEASATLLAWAERGFNRLTTSFTSFPDKFGSLSLHSRKYIQASMMPRLPSNQWQLDAGYWFVTALSSLQRTMVTFAAGPSRINPDIEKWIERPQTPEEEYICANQRIRSTSYASFSVFSLGVIFGLGLLIILISYILVPTISWIQERRKPKASYSVMEWTVNETLQLQRLANEVDDDNDRIWVNATDAIPITKSPNHVLGVLDISDPSHPKLARIPMEVKKLEKMGTGFSDKTKVGVEKTGTGSSDKMKVGVEKTGTGFSDETRVEVGEIAVQDRRKGWKFWKTGDERLI